MNDVINFEDYKKNKNKNDYKNVKVLMTINDLEIILDKFKFTKEQVEKFANVVQEIDINEISQEEFVQAVEDIYMMTFKYTTDGSKFE
tara:strand:+ start:458 stop:721 length:264 start_codon:yes stop_codon:yes gene_type:complete